MGMRYTICRWAISRSDPQNLLSVTLDVPLQQLQKDNSWRPITYLSRAMNETERNYEIYDHELLAIMEGLK